MRDHQLDPEMLVSKVSPLPFPPPQLSRGWSSLSRLPFGEPKPGAALTESSSPQKPLYSGRGNGSSWNFCFQFAHPSASRWSAAELGGLISFY